ncbi:MAG: hypothetical protein U0637_02315 [Phycisphaerales bacterium]
MRTLRRLFCAAPLLLLAPALAQPAPRPAVAGEGSEVQREVEQLFAAMSHAVLTRDVDGYLSLVAGGDREFLAEQRYFARDFAKPGKETKELSITLDPATLEVGDGSAFATVTYTWLQAKGEEGKDAKERTVSFPARFENENGVWKYGGEKWHKHEAPGVLVLFDEGLDGAAAAAAEAFTSVRGGVERSFGLDATEFPRRTKTIKLYSGMKHLQQSICLSYVDGLSGWNEPGEPLKLLTGAGQTKSERFRSLLAHEYGHCATFELGPKSNDMPWWVLEGVADQMTETVDDKARDRAVKAAERWSRAGTLAAWDDLADFEKVPDRLTGRVYTQGHAMMVYISETYTPAKRNAWMRAMSNGASIDQASTDVLGVSFAELDRQWRASLPAKDVGDGQDKPGGEKPQEGT